jgi:prophage regulatory protein
MPVMFDLHSISADPAPKTIIRTEEVLRKSGLSRTMLYSKIEKGEFPRQVPLGARAVGWYLEEVEDWIIKRAELRPELGYKDQVQHEAEEISAVSKKRSSGKAPEQKKLKPPARREATNAKAHVVNIGPVLTHLELVGSKVYLDRTTGKFWFEASEANCSERPIIANEQASKQSLGKRR